MLVRNLIAYLHQVVRLCPAFAPSVSLRVIAWGEATEVVEVEGEILPFRCVGKASADSLVILLTTHLANASHPRLLFISDGQWHRDELARLVQWRRSQFNISVRVIATGSDANLQHLQQMAGKSAVFNPEEIVAALHSGDGTNSAMLNEESRVLSSVEMGGGS